MRAVLVAMLTSSKMSHLHSKGTRTILIPVFSSNASRFQFTCFTDIELYSNDNWREDAHKMSHVKFPLTTQKGVDKSSKCNIAPNICTKDS